VTLDQAPDVMKVPEVAAVLRIGRNAAYELIQRGELQAVCIGRSVRVTRWALEAYLQGGDGHGAS
jgi:excisionase family DNA binding protein